MSTVKDLEGMTACLLVDSGEIHQWQYQALQRALERGLSISVVLQCTNTSTPRKPLKHAAYYTLNVTSMRHSFSGGVEWASLLDRDVPVHRFESQWEGIWQRIPPETLEQLEPYQVGACVKFGMSLLRDPDAFPATHGVLSFHHGDPAEYRGRPAGFYEVLHGADHVGVMVQRLSNELDAGRVLAYGAAQVVRHSYRATLDRVYRNGIYLLATALRNARADREVPRSTEGRNYRLPDNLTVGRFAVRLIVEKGRRLGYGLFKEKRWRIAYADPVDLVRSRGPVQLSVRDEEPVPVGYRFLADPSVLDEKTVLCEGMERRSGSGRILALGPTGASVVDTRPVGRGHLSNPHVVRHAGRTYLLPEMAQIGPQRLVSLGKGLEIVEVEPLEGLEDVRLTDPTVVHHAGRWWLFAGKPGGAADALFLWSAGALRGPYREHPDSPVVLDPSRARPAGPVQAIDGELFRLGQDNRGAYGDGVVVARVTELSTDRYEEEPISELRVEGARGPHTVVPWDGRLVIDVYDEVTDPLAGVRRLRSRLGSVRRPR